MLKVRKPRVAEYGKAYSVRFKKRLDKELQKYCLDREIRPSTAIQASIECFLENPSCEAHKRFKQ